MKTMTKLMNITSFVFLLKQRNCHLKLVSVYFSAFTFATLGFFFM